MTDQPRSQPDLQNQARGLDPEQLGQGPSPLDNHTVEQLRAMAASSGVEGADQMTKQQLLAHLDRASQTNAGDPAQRSPAPPPAAPTYSQANRPSKPSF